MFPRFSLSYYSLTVFFVFAPIIKKKNRLTITVEELKPIMDPIVGLFPHRFLWKLNQTEQVRANKHLLLGLLTARPQLDIFRYSL